MTREINRLKNKIEELTEQLETVSTKWKQSESIDRSLQEELLSAKKILQKKYDKMQEYERQLKEEVVNLRHHLEITKTQAAAQGELEQLRENNSASMRNLMEQKIRYLESKMKNSRGEAWKTELEGYRQLLSEELKARKSLSNRLDRTTERLNDLSCQLLKEQQKKKILIASCATSPAQEPSYIGNVNTSMFLSRNLFPRGDLEYSPGDPVSSESTVEAYSSKMQQELEESITRELNEVTDKIESRP